MNDATILGGTLNQLGQTAKKAVQQLVNLPEETSKEEKPQEKNQQWKSDEERVKFLRDLYGSSEKNSQNQIKPEEGLKDKKPTEFGQQIANKSPEEQKKLIELRQQLHKENYYDPTFNPPKKQEEERPAEKVENEKKKEMQNLQQKDAKKPPPLAVVRERNKTEMFRGASG